MSGLRVLVYCYFPPRADHLAGGAQQVLHDLLRGLAARGVQVDVICPTAQPGEPLLRYAGVRVHPVLLEPATDPLTPYERQLNLQHLAYAAQDADVVLSIDRVFPLQVEAPVVLMLNNFSYGTEVDSVFSFTWDSLTVQSAYLHAAVTAIAGPEHWRGGQRPIRIATPGIDQTHFRPTPTAALHAELGLDPGRYLLFPHRPDPDKGFDAALAVLQRLRDQGENIRLLVPTPPRSVKAAQEREQHFIQSLRDRITAMSLADAVVLHPWVPHRLLPAYYSAAECCLTPSRLPEGFGLTPLQAVSCGTPVVATPAGAIPALLPPDHGITLVPFDDLDAMAAATRAATSTGTDAVRRGRELIGRRYRVEQHTDTILGHLRDATKSQARYVPHAPRPTTAAPWWRETGNHERWHDYHMRPGAPTAAEQHHLNPARADAARQPLPASVLARGLLTGQLATPPRPEDGSS